MRPRYTIHNLDTASCEIFYVADETKLMDLTRLSTAAVSRPYENPDDAEALAAWLNERDAGYPRRDLPWPTYHKQPRPYSDEQGATWALRTPWHEIRFSRP